MSFPRFDIAAFLRYVDGKVAEGALTKEINEEVIRIKEHKEMRREYMTLLMELQKYKTEGMQEGIEIGMKQGIEKGMEKGIEKGRVEGREEGREEGRAEGKNEANTETAQRLLAMGLSAEQVAKATQLPLEIIKNLSNS